MQTAVSFKCHTCRQPITSTTVYVKATTPTRTTVRRFCCAACLRRWLRRC